MGRGGGKVVSALTFLSNNLSSSPTKVFNKIRTKMIMSRKLKTGLENGLKPGVKK